MPTGFIGALDDVLLDWSLLPLPVLEALVAMCFTSTDVHIPVQSTPGVLTSCARPTRCVHVMLHRRVVYHLELLMRWPLRQLEAAARLGLKGARGILLHGPPGTGKTLLLSVVAAKAGVGLVSVRLPQMIQSQTGVSKDAVSALFALSRKHAPCLIVLDEIQALFGYGSSMRSGWVARGGPGREVVSRLLEAHAPCDCHLMLRDHRQLERHGNAALSIAFVQAFLVVGMTNTPEVLAPALLGAGRFDHLVYMPPPSSRARRLTFAGRLECIPLNFASVGGGSEASCVGGLVERTTGFSVADLLGLCQQAILAVQRLQLARFTVVK